jgi:hypothetical protein
LKGFQGQPPEGFWLPGSWPISDDVQVWRGRGKPKVGLLTRPSTLCTPRHSDQWLLTPSCHVTQEASSRWRPPTCLTQRPPVLHRSLVPVREVTQNMPSQVFARFVPKTHALSGGSFCHPHALAPSGHQKLLSIPDCQQPEETVITTGLGGCGP